MAFTSKDVMELRGRTGVGMMDCKRALEACEGDMDKAIDFLREKGMASAAKKESRIAAEGIVYAASKNGKYALVEVNCESDFVASSDAFKAYVAKVADYVLDNDGVSVADVATALTADTNEAIMKIGEKLAIRRFTVYAANDSAVDTYIHMGGKIGVMVEAKGEIAAEVIHNVALQIAAANAQYICKCEVPADVVEKEKEILKAQSLNEENPKPLAIIEKMIEGRINKFYKEICLLDQAYVKDADMSIAQYLKANGGAEIIRFTRYQMGEGIEKRQDDLANEVAKMTGQAK